MLLQPSSTCNVAFFSVVSSKVDAVILGGVVFNDVMEVMDEQPEKALSSMDVTLLGMVTSVRPLHP